MVTKNRESLAAEAIRCYRNQTYPNKELVIVAQGDIGSNRLVRSVFGDARDVVMVEVEPSISLAAIRNLSVGVARGEYICQWDDDDYHHSGRVATHMQLMSGNVMASAYSQHLKYFADTKDLYWIDWSQEELLFQKLLCGAIMFRKEAFRRCKSVFYPEFTKQQDREEDLNVLKKLIKMGDVVPVEQGHQYIYRFHGANVYDLAHHRLVLDKVIRDKDLLLAHQKLLAGTFLDVGLKEANVRDRDSVVFHYNEGV